jgi:hypothetical protein
MPMVKEHKRNYKVVVSVDCLDDTGCDVKVLKRFHTEKEAIKYAKKVK